MKIGNLVILGAAFVATAPAHARPGGISGYSGNPAQNSRTCTSCHDGGAVPIVRITGPTTVAPGSTNAFSLTISGGERVDGSLDVSASQGILAAGAGTKILNGEVVHTSPKAVDSAGNVTFPFSWTAPAAAGTATLFGAGLSSNGSGTGGSGTALAQLAITVSAPAPLPNQPPSANAGGSYAGIAGTAIQFDASGSRDADGSIASYSWNFGDATSGTGVRPSHIYLIAGIYTVTVTVTDDKGASAQAQAQVQVAALPPQNQPPVANAGGPDSGLVGAVLQFDGSASSDPDGSIVSFAWDFGDGALSNEASPQHAFEGAGTYTVRLTVTDSKGATAQAQLQVTIATPDPVPVPNQAPVASIVGPGSAMAGAAAVFDGSASRDADGTIASYSWDFGDGAIAAGARAEHSYLAAGLYTVKLTVTDNEGASAQAETRLSISPSDPGEPSTWLSKIETPSLVRVERKAKSVKIRLQARAESRNAPCAVAYLEKDGAPYAQKRVCVSTRDGVSRYVATFVGTVRPADAGVLQWAGYFKLKEELSSKATRSMQVVIDHDDDDDDDDDDDHDDDDRERNHD